MNFVEQAKIHFMVMATGQALLTGSFHASPLTQKALEQVSQHGAFYCLGM